MCGRILAHFVQKGPKRAQTSFKFLFVLLFSVIIRNSKKYYTFAMHIVTDELFYLQPKCLQKVKISKGTDFLLCGRIILPA